MSNAAGAFSALAFVLGLSSCVMGTPLPPGPTPRVLGKDLPVYEAPKETGTPSPGLAEIERPQGTLKLRDALSLALLANPELQAFSWEVRAREAAALQAGLRPNPEISVEVENFAGSKDLRSFDGAETTTLLGQLVELGGKRTKRAHVAQLERDLAGWDYETRRIDVLTEVTKAFIGVLAAQDRLALAKELLRIAQRADNTVAVRVKEGAASSVDRRQAQVALATNRVEQRLAEHDLVIERNALVALWGDREAAFSEAEGELERVRDLPSSRDLMDRVENTPELARWATEFEQRRAALALEEAKRIPDVTVGGGYRRFNEANSNALVVELSVPLPVFDRNQGAAQEARYRLAKAEREHQAAQVRTHAALRAAYETLAATYDEAVSLRDEVLPLAESAFTSAEKAYRRGRFRYLEVLDSQRTLFELRGRYVDALSAYHAAEADIERLIGEPLDNVRGKTRKH